MPNELYENNQALVGFVLQKVKKNLTSDFLKLYAEDLHQEGLIGLWEASERYDPTRGVKFSTFAVSTIEKKMRSFVNSIIHYHRQGEPPKLVSIYEKAVDNLTFADMIAAPEHEDTLSLTEDTRLTEEEREVLRLLAKGYIRSDVGEILGITKQAAHQKVKKIRDKLKEE